MLRWIAVVAVACACNSSQSRSAEPKPAALQAAAPASPLVVKELTLYQGTKKYVHVGQDGRIDVFAVLPREDEPAQVQLGTLHPDGKLVYTDGTMLGAFRSGDLYAVTGFGQSFELRVHDEDVQIVGRAKMTVDARGNIRFDGQLDSQEFIVHDADDAATKRTAMVVLFLAMTEAPSVFWLQRPAAGE